MPPLCPKAVCQIPGDSDCFGCLIPRVSPPLGENIDRCINLMWHFVFEVGRVCGIVTYMYQWERIHMIHTA